MPPVFSSIKGSTCPLVKHLPALKKTGDTVLDQDREQQRDAFLRVIVKLWDNPSHSLPCDDWLRGRLDRDLAADGIQSEFCFKQAPATIADIEYEWICVYLKRKLGLTDGVLGKIKAFDPESIRFLFCLYLSCTPSLKCPEDAIDRRVLTGFCDLRHQMGPTRLAEWSNDKVLPTGQILWGAIGSFGLAFAEKKLQRILHRASGTWVTVDADLGVDEESWLLEQNWCDTKAKLVKSKARRFSVLGFFTGDAGLPKEGATWTGSVQQAQALWQAASEMVNALDAAAASAGSAPELGSEFHTPLKAKQEAASKRAREQLQASNEAKAAKRRVSVAAAGVSAAAVGNGAGGAQAVGSAAPIQEAQVDA